MLSFENRVYKCVSSCVIFGPSLVLIRAVGAVCLCGLGQSHRCSLMLSDHTPVWSGVKQRVSAYIHQVPRLRMYGAILPLAL
jgi:hypothetical protein